MKAIILSKYRSPEFFELKVIKKPKLRDNEVLVKIVAVSINSWDWELLIAKPFVNRLMAGLLALQALRYKGQIQPGQKVLFNGAGGGVGTLGMQIAKSFGANRVIDYTKEDFTKDETKYSFVFDTVGKSSFFKCKHLLQSGGVYISSDLGYISCTNGY